MNTVAESGFHRLHRQDIAGWSFAFGMSHYMLLGPPGWTNGSHDLLTPHPDFYTTLLFRQNIGQKLLASALASPADPSLLDVLDVHAWCSGARSPVGAAGLTITYVNFGAADHSITLPPALAAAPGTLFSLTATPSGTPLSSLQSDAIYLNGVLLSVDSQGNLPENPLKGVPFTGGASFTAPAYSYGFIVFAGNFGVCGR